MNVLRLIPEQGGEAIAIDQDRVLVGRDSAADIHLRDASVSRQHAEIRKNDDEWVIIDLKSGNGVLIDGVRTSHDVLLPGQRLQLGNVRFLVQIDRGDDGSTVILGRSPLLAAGDSTVNFVRPPAASQRRGVLLTLALVAAGPVVVALGLLALYWSSPKALPSPPRPAPASFVTPTVLLTPSPIAASPAPQPARKIQPPTSTLLIATDIRAKVLVDGRRSITILPGGLRRVQVSPGEHIVSFRVGGARHDQVVRTKANEQAVVRFPRSASPGAPSILVRATEPMVHPQPSPTLALRTAAVSPVLPPPSIVPSPAQVSPTPSFLPSTLSSPVRQSATDEGLLSGTAATARGDFFRALLILKDVAKRLEGDPQAKKELARTEAYLAWTYYGLKRPEQAQAAAERALRADPNVIAQLKNFPAAVTSLLKQAR